MAKQITKLITNVIVGDLRLINLVDGDNFRQLMHELAPGYNIPIPSRRTISRNIEDQLVQCKIKLKNLLKNGSHVALTTDMWTNIKMHSFLGVTAHFIDTDTFKLVNMVIATKEVNDMHSAKNIVSWLETVLSEYELSPHQVFTITTDNGSNIVSACKMLHEKYQWKHVRCAAHTLQLCLKSGLDIPQVKSAVGMCF